MRVPGEAAEQARLARHHHLRDAAAAASSATRTFSAIPPAIVPSCDAGARASPRRATRPFARPPARRPRPRGTRGARARTARARPSAASSALTLTATPSGPLRHRRDHGQRGRPPTARPAAPGPPPPGAPTRPRPGSQPRADAGRASRPERPTAGRPAAVRPAASALLTAPERTISTTSIAAGEVSRRPLHEARLDAQRAAACARRGGHRRAPPATRAARRRSSLGQRRDQLGILERRPAELVDADAGRSCRDSRATGSARVLGPAQREVQVLDRPARPRP